MDTRYSSKLPGAWSENWRDSQEIVDHEKPASRPERPEPEVRPINPSCVASVQPLISETNSPSAGMDNSLCSPFEDTVSLYSNSEEDSNLSDDFYSIISEDGESSNVTLLQLRNGFNGTIDKGKGKAQDVQHPAALLKGSLHPSVLSSRLHEVQDVTFSNDVASKLHVLQAAQPPAESEQSVLNTDGSLVSRTLDYVHEASISASSRTSFIFQDDSSCSSGSVRFKKYDSDDESVCSNYGRVYTMMNRLVSGRNTMSTSVESTPRGPTQSSSRLITFRQINPRRVNPDSTSLNHSSTFSISHPDGNNPWTLSLDPTVTSYESSPSQISSRSFSLHSLNVESPQRQSPHSSFFYARSPASSIRQSRSTPQNRSGIHDTYRPTRQGLNPLDHSRYALPATGSQGVYHGIPAHDLVDDSKPGNKNVLQKTKALCNKLKKLIVPKKPRQKIEEQCVIETSASGYLDTDMELPPLLPYLNSPSTPTSVVTPSWSFGRGRHVKRLRKVSSPPESTTKAKCSSIENKNSYEYHSRPKTLAEIKSSRRFSLPVFRASASQNHASK